MKWNQGKWITLPVGFANRLRDNDSDGLAVFGSDYLALVGVDALADSGKLKITYH